MNKKRVYWAWMLLAVAWSAFAQRQSGPNQWEKEIQAFQELDRESPPPKNAVLFIGSSSIRVWKDLQQDFPGIPVINRGFGGSEIADSTFYADRIVFPYQPRLIVLYAGDNDLANGKTPQQVLEDYTAFVNRVHAQLSRTKIAFISIKPSPARASLLPKMKEANQLLKAYISHDPALTYIDVFTPMLDKNGQPRGELFGPDGLHMNRAGYVLWKSVITPLVEIT
jgi:lysophospholipase L1-like esterase